MTMIFYFVGNIVKVFSMCKIKCITVKRRFYRVANAVRNISLQETTQNYLHEEITVTLNDGNYSENYTRRLQTEWAYSMKSAIFKFAAAWNELKTTTLVNGYKRLLNEVEKEIAHFRIRARSFMKSCWNIKKMSVTNGA